MELSEGETLKQRIDAHEGDHDDPLCLSECRAMAVGSFVGRPVHDMAPVAPHRFEIEQDEAVLPLGLREDGIGPGHPVQPVSAELGKAIRDPKNSSNSTNEGLFWIAN